MTRYCPDCGRDNRDQARFCTDCGANLHPDGTHRLTVLDERYEIQAVVKSGAMGCVYKALDSRLGNTVAVKKMLSSVMNSQERQYSEKRFQEEARILSTLSHPGIPKVSDFFTVKDPDTGKPAHYLVMTFIKGKDLDTLIREKGQNQFSLEMAMDFFRQILEILDFLHSRTPPVVYRDIKPSNIMVSWPSGLLMKPGEMGFHGKVSLVDFGIARIFQPRQKGTAIGTPGYAAPEQYKGFAEPRSDIFSLGALIHYMLTGKDPEDPDRGPFSFEPLTHFNPSIPPYLDNLVMRMLEIVPENRPGSTKEIKEILENRTLPAGYKAISTAAPSVLPDSSDGSLHTLGQFTGRQLSRSGQQSNQGGPRKNGMSSLHHAANDGDTDQVESLLDKGAGINDRDDDGMTPLHRAAMWGYTETVRILLEHGADYTLRDDYGMTAFDWAKANGHLNVAKSIRLKKIGNLIPGA